MGRIDVSMRLLDTATSITPAGVLTGLLVAALPFVASRHLFYGAVNAKYFFVVGIVSLAALLFTYLLFAHKHTVRTGQRWLLWGLAALLVVYYLAAFLGVSPALSLWSDVTRSTGIFFLTYIAFLAFFAGEVLGERDFLLVRWAVALSSAVFALWSFFDPALASGGVEVSGLTFGNSTFAGAYLLLAFVVTLMELSRSRRGSKARLALIAAAVIQALSPVLLANQLWTGTATVADVLSNPVALLGAARASSAVLVAGLLYMAGWFVVRRLVPSPARTHAVLGWRGLAAAGTLCLVALLFVPGSFVQEGYIRESTAARVFVWNEGLAAFADRPLLGWGPETFRLAHERHFDSRLYLKENIGEVWFDRAHNVVVDTLVATGILGALVSAALVVLFLRTVVRARRQGLVGDAEAELLFVFPFAHFLQLQTSFDTIATYVLSAAMLGYALFLERRMVEVGAGAGIPANPPSALWRRAVAGTLVLGVLAGSVYLLAAEYSRQHALFMLFATKDTERHLSLIDRMLAGPPRFEPLRLGSSALIKGGLVGFTEADAADRPAVQEALLTELKAYDRHYARYLSRVPEDYRARANYSYLLLVASALGENRLEDARAVIRDLYVLTPPDNPLPYVFDALAALYGGSVEEAKQIMDRAIALNPDIELSQNVRAYVDEQERRLPRITILKLENL